MMWRYLQSIQSGSPMISHMCPKIKLYPFKGQTQKYFLVRLKKGAKIDLFAHEIPEFEEYRFVTLDELFKRATFLKRRAYRRVIDYFIKEGLM